jgi:uncharacterized protein (DUF1330 family)
VVSTIGATARLLLLAGIVIGATGGQSLHAHAKPPVYVIANNDITNPDAYTREYLPLAQASIKEHGGPYIAAGKGTAIDGEPPKGRVVILRWDCMEQPMAWRYSPDYEKARAIGERYAKYNLMAVGGVPQ